MTTSSSSSPPPLHPRAVATTTPWPPRLAPLHHLHHHLSHLHLLLLLVPLLLAPPGCGGAEVKAGSPVAQYSEAVFSNPDKPGNNFLLVEVNKNTQDIYIGAKNKIYRLDPALKDLGSVSIGPNQDTITCISLGTCQHADLLDNSPKVMAIDYAGDHLVLCVTRHLGVCEKRDLKTLATVGDPSDERVVSSNPDTSTVGFIAPGPAPEMGDGQVSVLYVAETWSTSKIGDQGSAFSSRRLSDFTPAALSGTLFTKTAILFESTKRQTFLVQYVYGFSSENFSYMLTVQQKDDRHYHSVIFRVCQEDRNFYSYVEVPLNCTRDGVAYNRLRVAYLAKPGRELALSLRVNTQTEVLFAIFTADSAPDAGTATASAAMCIFPMNYVRESFTDNIKHCFAGQGSYGGGHLYSSAPCRNNQEFDITDDFCGATDANQPLQGALPIHSTAHMTFTLAPGVNVTSLHVAVTDPTTDKYTVAFVGTQTGHMLKVSLDSGHVYENVPLGGNGVKAMAFDDSKENIYLLTDRSLLKLTTSNCSQYTSCLECIGAKDPYCGWCSKDYKCNRRSLCHPADVANGWLSYDSDQCPVIKDINPDKVHRGKARPLTINIQHVPSIPNFNEFRCVFTPYVGGTSPSWTQANKLSSNKFQCYTPEVDKWPQIGLDGNDSVLMKLTVDMNKQELVQANITFFDCEYHRTCDSCAQSKFPCSWCIKQNKCTDNREQYCSNDNYILPLSQQGPYNPLVNYGANYCPRFESLAKSTEILVPAGNPQVVTVQGLAMGMVDTSDIRCQFIFINQVVTVAARFNASTYHISCDKTEFKYIQDTSTQDVKFSILWSGSNNPLGNEQDVHVVMYKCPLLAATCGDCLLLEAKYHCGWCDNLRCDIQDFCLNSPFSTKGAVCKDIHILHFKPKSGPTDGGTRVTIVGQNFGSRQDQIEVAVGNTTQCIVKHFKAPKRIVCEMQQAFSPTVGPIHLTVEKMYSARSQQFYSFVVPRITDMSPKRGPEAGGTLVTLRGQHLDAGSSKAVSIGAVKCLETISVNASALLCRTPAQNSSGLAQVRVQLIMDNAKVEPQRVVFQYVTNPNISAVSRDQLIRSGGLVVNVSGEHLQHVQSPKMLLWYQGQPYSGECKFLPAVPANMSCSSPLVASLSPEFSTPMELEFGFSMDDVASLRKLTSRLGKIKVFPDPVLNKFENGEKVHQQNTEQLYINGQHLEPVRQQDVQVMVGQAYCVVTSVVSSVIICTPPTTQPAPALGSGFPEVKVQIGENLTFTLGILRYEKQEGLSEEAIIGIGGGVVLLVIIMIVVCIVCFVKSRRNDDKLKIMRKEMDQLESGVANECKEAFAELQTDMNELTSDLSGNTSIPFWDYRTYCMRVLFPGCNDHPVIKELELDYRHREDTERGLKLFFNLIRNKTFLLIFIRTLESNPDFFMKERVTVASLISVALQTQMEYATDILKTLLAELIEKTVENPQKYNPKLLLRRNESVGEKMLTNWFTFLLYRFLKECAGEPLFMLYGAMKQQVSKGPVDSVTGEARYCLSEDKLIRQKINFKPMVLNVMDVDVDRCSQPAHPVKVLDCDTISQVKEKILDAMYKSAPFSSRPPKEELDLVLFEHPTELILQDKNHVPMKVFPNKDTKRLVLSDEDNSTKSEGDCRRLNTLSHYKVGDGAYVALHPKQTSIYNMSIMSEKSNKFSENSFYNRSPSLNRSVNTNNVNNIDPENCKVYHLVRHQDVESNTKEGERGGKMVSEIYLPRLLVTKGTLQTFVDELFERIFSTAHRGTVLPLAIKYMFDFLDDQALHHSMADEVVHRWKSNSLPLRFWVNVIKNPNFAFDIYKSNIVDACLTVIGQTFMDCCSTNEHKLTKDSPSGKLLYAKDIPKYKQWVSRYYQDIKIMPAISDQDMTAMLAEESRIHQNEFNTNAALLELYKYVRKYYDDIVNALEDDEFAKKSKLTYKLDQVSAAMEGTTVC